MKHQLSPEVIPDISQGHFGLAACIASGSYLLEKLTSGSVQRPSPPILQSQTRRIKSRKSSAIDSPARFVQLWNWTHLPAPDVAQFCFCSLFIPAYHCFRSGWRHPNFCQGLSQKHVRIWNAQTKVGLHLKEKMFNSSTNTMLPVSWDLLCQKKLIHTPNLPVYMTYESHQSLNSEPCFDRTLLRRDTEPIRIRSRRTSNRVRVLAHVTVGISGYFSIRRVTGRVARKAQSKPSQIPLYWCFESFPRRWYISSLFGLHVIENAMVWSHNRSKFELKAASLCANHCFLQQRDGITTCIPPWWLARKDLASWRWSERDDYCQNDLTTRLLQISQYFKLSCRKDPKLHVHWPDVMT